MNTRRFLLFFNFIWLLPEFILFTIANASTTPSVTGVSGTISDGKSIIITGSNFKVSGPNVYFFDNFENGVSGNHLTNGAAAVVGNWGRIGVVPPEYTNLFHHSGRQAFLATSDPNYEVGQYGEITLPNSTDVFASFWAMVPDGDDWPGEHSPLGPELANWKLTWFDKDGLRGGTGEFDCVMACKTPSEWYVGGNCGHWVHENPPYGNYLLYPTKPQMVKGTWHRFWYWYHGATNTTGEVKFWNLENTGVVLLVDDRGVTTMAAGDYFNRFVVNGYCRIQSPGYTARQLFDDVYLALGANAQARVEIGNASTYAASTNLTIITPTAWSDTQITATVRQGSFSNNQQAYLYVFDSNGVVNTNGYSMTFGAVVSNGSSAAAADVDLKGRIVLAFPNPTKGHIQFVMHLEKAARVEIMCFNLAGEQVAHLSENLPAGQGQRLTWNCESVAPGIYLARVLLDGVEKSTLKVAITKH